ncbi:hypothetical protein DFH06DRAFT_105740 [Mycena polygramma]|nr:hypothetical protein DFH06DRAFT_105740 [Mycena polygramma]
MPKAKPSTTENQYMVLTDGRRRVLVLRPKTYKAAVETARRHFPSIREEDLIFQTDELAICDGKMTEIAAESWNMVDLLSLVVVTERQTLRKPSASRVPSASAVGKHTASGSGVRASASAAAPDVESAPTQDTEHLTTLVESTVAEATTATDVVQAEPFAAQAQQLRNPTAQSTELDATKSLLPAREENESAALCIALALEAFEEQKKVAVAHELACKLWRRMAHQQHMLPGADDDAEERSATIAELQKDVIDIMHAEVRLWDRYPLLVDKAIARIKAVTDACALQTAALEKENAALKENLARVEERRHGVVMGKTN